MSEITIEADPETASASDGPYNSLFYDPAFYDTTRQTWTLESDPQTAVVIEET